MAVLPNSKAGTVAKAPLKEPTGVRAAEAMTMSVMGMLTSVGRRAASRHSCCTRYRTSPARIPTRVTGLNARKQALTLALHLGKGDFGRRLDCAGAKNQGSLAWRTIRAKYLRWTNGVRNRW